MVHLVSLTLALLVAGGCTCRSPASGVDRDAGAAAGDGAARMGCRDAQVAVDGAAFEVEETLGGCASDADCVAAAWLVECPDGQFRRCDFAYADARREEALERMDEETARICAALDGPCVADDLDCPRARARCVDGWCRPER